jgi:hypothetical protein
VSEWSKEDVCKTEERESNPHPESTDCSVRMCSSILLPIK